MKRQSAEQEFNQGTVPCSVETIKQGTVPGSVWNRESFPLSDLYRLADLCVKITSLHDYVHAYCADYRFPRECSRVDQPDVGQPDIDVCITQADIEYERKKSARTYEAESIPVRQPSDPYLETLAVYRQIAEQMPFFDTFLIHGSCIAVDGEGYLFIARSGTGKSTHTRLWRELLGGRAFMVNDDKPLIRIMPSGEIAESVKDDSSNCAETATDGKYTALIYGTPWCGKHKLNTNTSVPLRAICILERGRENSIREITKSEALPSLFRQIYRTTNHAALERTLALIDKLNVRFYRLACNMDPEAAKVSYSAMSDRETG